MPWQRLVADIGGELDPETGGPAYRDVIFTVPRQSGKTTLLLGWELQRALGWGSAQRIVYSAQTGLDARKKLIEDQLTLMEPHRKALGIRQVRRGLGSEAIEFVNGSRLGLLASTADSGHGRTVDLAIKDELFADADDRRDQSLVPAMATKVAGQVVTASTMGTPESVPWNRAVDLGRAAVEAGRRSGIAYFEWSAHPRDDPDDPETWWGCMPALGRTISEGVVRHARATLTDGEFRRAFLNLQTQTEERVIPETVWAAVCSESAAPEGEIVFAVDVNPERSAGTIAAAGVGGERPSAEVVDYHPTIGWIVRRAVELNSRHGAARWVVDAMSPAGSLIADLEREGLSVHPVSAREAVEACGTFYDAIVERTVRIRTHPRLNEAVAAAAKRSVGDAWAWTRKAATGDISPLVAVTNALWWAMRDSESVYEDRELMVL